MFQSILLSLEENHTIQLLDLRETDIPPELLAKINKLLERNRPKEEEEFDHAESDSLEVDDTQD